MKTTKKENFSKIITTTGKTVNVFELREEQLLLRLLQLFRPAVSLPVIYNFNLVVQLSLSWQQDNEHKSPTQHCKCSAQQHAQHGIVRER